MKRIFISFIFLLLSALSAFAQSTQSGYVKQYNEKLDKTSLAGVEINVYGASSTQSDNRGAFTLNFNTLKPGDKVAYSKISKADYVLFNTDKLDQWNISKDNIPFTIIMCKASKFKAIKDNYLKVSSASYARQQKKEEAALEAEFKAHKKTEAAYRKELYNIRQYYAEQLKNIDTYVDHFSRIDLSELAPEEQAIIDLIQSGDIESAINKYENLNYLSKYEQELREVKELEAIKSTLEATKSQKLIERDSVFNIVMRQVDAYKLAGGKENLDKAGNLLKLCADADTTNLNVVYDCAKFFYNQKDFNTSLHYYNICLNLCGDNISQNALIQNNLAVLYSDIHDYQKSEKYCLQALENRKILFNGNPDAHRAGLAGIQNNLGNLYSHLHDYQKSKEFCLQALENYKVLFTSNPDAYRPDLANTQNNLGYLYSNLHDYQKSEEYYLQAVENYKVLFNNNPDTYRSDLANTQNNLGHLYFKLHDYQKSEKYYLQALENYKVLFASNPDAYGPDLAITQNNLGLLYSNLHDYQKSEEYYLQALENYKVLFASNPDAYRPEMATTQNNLGGLYSLLHDYQKSEKYYLQALENRKILFNSNPNAYRSNMANTQNNLGYLYYGLHDYQKSEEYYLQVLENYKVLFASNPDAYRPEMATTQNNLGLLYYGLHDYQKSEEYFLLALESYKVLFASNPDAYRPELATAQNNLGLLYSDLHDYQKSEEYYLQALENYKLLFANNSDAYRTDLATIHFTLGVLYIAQDKFEKGLVYINNAISVLPDETILYDIKGAILLAMNKDQEALSIYNKILELNPKFYTDNYPNGTNFTNKLKEKGLIK